MSAGQYRKALAVLALAVVQVAAYIIANPADLPAWVLAAAGLVNTLAVYWVRNDPPAKPAPNQTAADEVFGPRNPSKPFK